MRTSSLLARALPADVAWDESFGDLPAELFPEETRVVAGAVPARRREFATVRACARSGLARLGYERVAILPGTGGAPVWPAGVVGSMTHCDGYRAAAVSSVRRYLALGIDAEPDAALPAGVLRLVTSEGERACLAAHGPPDPEQPSWDRLLFCAKEAVYKVWYPSVGTWLGFEDVDVSWDANDGTFEAQIHRPGLVLGGRVVTRLHGRWAREAGLICAAIAVPSS